MRGPRLAGVGGGRWFPANRSCGREHQVTDAPREQPGRPSNALPKQLARTYRRVAVGVLAAAAVYALWELSAVRAMDRAVSSLADEDPARRTRAAAYIGRKGQAAIPSLIHGFRLAKAPSVPKKLPRRIVSFLYSFDRGAVTRQLIEALEDDRPAVRNHAGLTLAILGDDALGPVVVALETAPRPSTRTASAWILALMGPGAARAEPALKAALQDEHKDVRFTARYAMSRLGASNDRLEKWRRGLLLKAFLPTGHVRVLDLTQVIDFASGVLLLVVAWAYWLRPGRPRLVRQPRMRGLPPPPPPRNSVVWQGRGQASFWLPLSDLWSCARSVSGSSGHASSYRPSSSCLPASMFQVRRSRCCVRTEDRAPARGFRLATVPISS